MNDMLKQADEMATTRLRHSLMAEMHRHYHCMVGDTEEMKEINTITRPRRGF